MFALSEMTDATLKALPSSQYPREIKVFSSLLPWGRFHNSDEHKAKETLHSSLFKPSMLTSPMLIDGSPVEEYLLSIIALYTGLGHLSFSGRGRSSVKFYLWHLSVFNPPEHCLHRGDECVRWPGLWEGRWEHGHWWGGWMQEVGRT